jgi:hypothetical protein
VNANTLDDYLNRVESLRKNGAPSPPGQPGSQLLFLPAITAS